MAPRQIHWKTSEEIEYYDILVNQFLLSMFSYVEQDSNRYWYLDEMNTCMDEFNFKYKHLQKREPVNIHSAHQTRCPFINAYNEELVDDRYNTAFTVTDIEDITEDDKRVCRCGHSYYTSFFVNGYAYNTGKGTINKDGLEEPVPYDMIIKTGYLFTCDCIHSHRGNNENIIFEVENYNEEEDMNCYNEFDGPPIDLKIYTDNNYGRWYEYMGGVSVFKYTTFDESPLR